MTSNSPNGTLQTFAVFSAVVLMNTKCSFTSIAVWILLGAAGMPVFSNFKGGISVLAGPTGGYILGMLLCPLVTALIKKLAGDNFDRIPVKAAALLLALIVCYAFGTVWFVVLYTRTKGAITVWAALKLCVLPFLLFDLIKIVLAIILENRVGKYVKLN